MARQKFEHGDIAAVHRWGGRERTGRKSDEVWDLVIVVVPEVDEWGGWRVKRHAKAGGDRVGVVDEEWRKFYEQFRDPDAPPLTGYAAFDALLSRIKYVYNSRKQILPAAEWERTIHQPQVQRAKDKQSAEEKKLADARVGARMVADEIRNAPVDAAVAIVYAKMDKHYLAEVGRGNRKVVENARP